MSVDLDGFTNNVETDNYVRARRSHDCCACGETIRRGDVYMRRFICSDHHPCTYKQCLRCSEITEHLLKTHRTMDDDVGVALDLDCGHTYEEIHGEPPPEHIARLAFLTKDEMQAQLGPRP